MMDARLVSLAEPHKRALVVGADDEEGRWVRDCVSVLFLIVGWAHAHTGGRGTPRHHTLTLLNP